MLQQTQTDRVVEKYQLFIKTFPNFRSLAKSPLSKVLQVWQGMGYNRRAISLHKIAQIVVDKYQGKLPESVEELIELPGIGHYTASAIGAFAFNQPTAFIETNIRRVYIHFFFQKKRKVDDKDILPLVEQTVDKKNPREWYYALMDYGVMLGKQVPNPNRKSAHYAKQSKFEGSNRQIRGLILKILLKQPNLTESMLIKKLDYKPTITEERRNPKTEKRKNPKTQEQYKLIKIKEILIHLEKEGFIKKKNKRYFVA
jgi:A/G-specific adenine glycosylase